MKSFVLALVALLALGCSQSASNKVKQENVAEAAAKQKAIVDLPVMTFDRTEHNFGTINEGDIVETSFVFTNTGNSDLMISDARGSCGCTVPEYPKNIPIAPGETRDIKVKFDSANKPGNQTKTVTLTNNTERGRDIIRIRTIVTADPVKEQQRQEARNQINQ